MAKSTELESENLPISFISYDQCACLRDFHPSSALLDEGLRVDLCGTAIYMKGISLLVERDDRVTRNRKV